MKMDPYNKKTMKILIVVCFFIIIIICIKKNIGNAQSSLVEYYITEVGLPFVHGYNFTSK